jgi:cysteinyl-tRNA synthetase
MSGSSWRAWVDAEDLPHVEWKASVWSWVELPKRRTDEQVFEIIRYLVCFRREKQYEQADIFRQKLLDDGATVEIDKHGVIRVYY